MGKDLTFLNIVAETSPYYFETVRNGSEPAICPGSAENLCAASGAMRFSRMETADAVERSLARVRVPPAKWAAVAREGKMCARMGVYVVS